MFAIEDQDHTEINRLLTNGADPNFVDANCTNGLCTPLHIAVAECDPKSVKILLRWGAKFDTKLRNHKSPWELAKSDFQIRPIFEEHFRCTPRLSVAKNSSNPTTSSEGEYHRRPGSAGISGQLYEARLMALVYLRLERLGCQFYLGSNVDGIGNFDDLVVRYRCEGADRDTLLFVQAKHREEPDKNKIKFAAVEDVTCEKGDFSVHTNFKNYLMIREQFGRDRSGGFFEGNFEDLDVELVLYTSAKYEYTLVRKVSNSDLLKTNDEGGILQVDDESEIITNLCKSAAKNMVKNILQAEKKLIGFNCIKHLANDFLKKFRIYFNQAKEDSVRRIVLNEFDDRLYALEFLDVIQMHWMQSGIVKFLTETCNLSPIVNICRVRSNSSGPVFAENQMEVVEYLPTTRLNIRLLFEIEDKNHRKMLELLHFEKADANFFDANATNGNSTPLHMAVAMNDPISVQILLNAGAKLIARNNKGESACEMALRLKYADVLSVVHNFIVTKLGIRVLNVE